MRFLKTKVGLTFTIMILSSVIIGLSYAAFVYTSSSYKASELMISNLMYGIDITSTGGSETISGTSVTLSSGSTSTVLVKITSLNPIDSNYGLDYKITSGSGNIYYTKSTESLPTGSINGYNNTTYSKTITVLIDATSNMTVQFNVTGGYTYTSDLTPASGYTRLSEVYVYDLTGQYAQALGNLQNQFTKDSQNQIKFNSKQITFTNNCTNASARFNYVKGIYEIRNIVENANCDLGFTSSNTVQYLNDYVISLNNRTVGDGKVVHEISTVDNSTFTAGAKLERSGYTSISNDASYPYAWDDTNKTWTSTNHTDSKTATITFNVATAGAYQVCYMQSSEKNYDYAIFYKDGTQVKSLKGISNSSYDCFSLGNLTTSNTIKVTYQKDSSGSSGSDNVIFYLQGGTYNENIQTVIAGYRYEGTNPNNYVLYNGELWRIIGVFGNEMHGQTGNLVKIIKNDSIGGLVYNTSSGVNSWGASTLYKLLNQTSGGSYYTGVDYTNKASGTYCSSNFGNTPRDCSFSKTGIRSDYARGMIQQANWYSTAYSSISNAPTTYTYDITTTTSNTGYIGMMYASDYGYAVQASDCARTISLGSYSGGTNGLTCTGKNWLRLGNAEWTISRNSSNNSWHVESDGHVTFYGNVLIFGEMNNSVDDGYAVRPVLYLKSSVYYVSGSGTYNDPIVIGN